MYLCNSLHLKVASASEGLLTSFLANIYWCSLSPLSILPYRLCWYNYLQTIQQTQDHSYDSLKQNKHDSKPSRKKPAAQQKGGSRGSREHRQAVQESATAIEAPVPGPTWFMNYFYISQGFLFVIKLTFQSLISQKSKIGKSLIDKLLRNVYNSYKKKLMQI